MEIINELISYGEKRIKIVGSSENPWFCGKDVCEILGYKDIKDALKKHIKITHKKNLLELGRSALQLLPRRKGCIYF